MKALDAVTECIYCGKPLSKWESIRSYCWNCNEMMTSEAYEETVTDEDLEAFDEMNGNDNWYDLVF
jgi:predicted amidophosphoribosyltransferase